MHNEYVHLVESLNDDSIYPIEILNSKYLNETSINELINKTDKERLRKAEKEVRTTPPKVTTTNDGYEALLYNVKAFPSREKKRHRGYIIHTNGDIHHLFCDCKDFYYRLYDALVNANLATYNLNDNFLKLLIGPLSQIPKASPNQPLFVCKHLASMRRYI